MSDKPIIFFDGVCGICNGFVDWVLRHDDKQTFYFSPLQGETARELLKHSYIESVVLFENKQSKLKSQAVFAIVSHLGMPWRLLGVLRWIPLGLRDRVYDEIAKRRYRWFGKREQCRLPTEEEKKYFLP